MDLKRIILLMVFAIACTCSTPLQANDAPPAPGDEEEMITLPLDEKNLLHMTEFLRFTSKTLGIPLLFTEAETTDVHFQFTEPVKVSRADFQGYFERLLLEKGFIYAQSGEGANAVHRIHWIEGRSGNWSSLKANTPVVSLSDLEQYKNRGILITMSVPLKHLHAREVMTSLNFYFPNQQIESIRPVENNDSLILTSTACKIYRIIRLLQLMDVESKAAPDPVWVKRLEVLQEHVIALEKQLEDAKMLEDQSAK